MQRSRDSGLVAVMVMHVSLHKVRRKNWVWDRSVTIVTAQLLAEARDFSLLRSVQLRGTSTSYSLSALSLGVSWGRHEAYHLHPNSTSVNNVWCYTESPHMPSQCGA
jgi:hypothetical protein